MLGSLDTPQARLINKLEEVSSRASDEGQQEGSESPRRSPYYTRAISWLKVPTSALTFKTLC